MFSIGQCVDNNNNRNPLFCCNIASVVRIVSSLTKALGTSGWYVGHPFLHYTAWSHKKIERQAHAHAPKFCTCCALLPVNRGSTKKFNNRGGCNAGNSSCACMRASSTITWWSIIQPTLLCVRVSLLFFAHLFDDERIPPSRP
ncbi:unnamed protein product [Ectocarpus sp. 12 AP-2014]